MVDRVDGAGVDPEQSAAGRQQADLALDRALDPHPGAAQALAQVHRGGVLVDVAGVELHHVHLRHRPQPGQVVLREHGALAQVGAEVVGQHPAPDLVRGHPGAIDPHRPHSGFLH